MIVLPTANGTESELTALSCLGSFIVVGAGCAVLRFSLSEEKNQYVLAEQSSLQNAQQHIGMPYEQSFSVIDALGVQPPPSSLVVDVKDIK
jgi:hypothetical protein